VSPVELRGYISDTATPHQFEESIYSIYAHCHKQQKGKTLCIFATANSETFSSGKESFDPSDIQATGLLYRTVHAENNGVGST